jgi:hypothetical protein
MYFKEGISEAIWEKREDITKRKGAGQFLVIM